MNNSKAAKARPTDESQDVVGVRFQMEVVVREDVTIPFDETGGQTLGQMLDRHLMALAKDGGEPHNFAFSFTPEAWEAAKPAYVNMSDDFFSDRHTWQG